VVFVAATVAEVAFENNVGLFDLRLYPPVGGGDCLRYYRCRTLGRYGLCLFFLFFQKKLLRRFLQNGISETQEFGEGVGISKTFFLIAEGNIETGMIVPGNSSFSPKLMDHDLIQKIHTDTSLSDYYKCIIPHYPKAGK
jgi:hypothetical protein